MSYSLLVISGKVKVIVEEVRRGEERRGRIWDQFMFSSLSLFHE